VLLFGALLLREPITKVQGIGALVILSGVAIINVSSFSEPLGMHMGDLFILCGAIVFGLGEVLFKKYLSHIMPELALVIRNIIGISAVLILSLTFRYSFGGEMASFPVSKIMLLVAFAFFARYLNLTFYYEAMDRLPSTTLSMVSIATPLTGLLFAVVILGEQLQPAHVLGGLVIVFGLLIEQSSSRAVRALRQRWSLAHIPFLRKHQDDRPVFFPGHA
jgi:drug/metabolite transporter (DMT)-like permease